MKLRSGGKKVRRRASNRSWVPLFRRRVRIRGDGTTYRLRLLFVLRAGLGVGGGVGDGVWGLGIDGGDGGGRGRVAVSREGEVQTCARRRGLLGVVGVAHGEVGFQGAVARVLDTALKRLAVEIELH